MNIIFVIFSFFVLFVSIKTVAPPIGKYPGYLSWAKCGLAKINPKYPEIKFPKKCIISVRHKSVNKTVFNDKYMKSSDTQNRVLNGREAQEYESPWTVMLEYIDTGAVCTGSIIGERWILTAAHCVDANNISRELGGRGSPIKQIVYNLKVYYGSSDLSRAEFVYALEGYPNPDYIYGNQSTYRSDIGLIKLKDRIPKLFDETKQYFRTNTICLPEKTYKSNLKLEYGYAFGWGLTNGNTPVSKLRRGEYLLQPCLSYPGMNFSGYLCSVPQFSDRGCSGDSGSGLVQYRQRTSQAVLIGIFISNDNNTIVPEVIPCTSAHKRNQFLYLYKWFDWILNTIQTNNN